MAKRAALLVATLLAGALLAAAGVAAALILLGHGIFGPSAAALSQTQVRRELAEQRSATSSGPASAPADPRRSTPPPAAAAAATARSFAGGTVYASCSAGQVTLANRVPAPGYAIASVSPGPAASASVRFSSGTSDELVTVKCAGDRPSFTANIGQAGNDENHGGGKGRGSGGGDG